MVAIADLRRTVSALLGRGFPGFRFLLLMVDCILSRLFGRDK